MAGPLLQERLRFITHRIEQGLDRWSLREIARYLIIVARYLRLEERPDDIISRDEIEQQALCWAAQPTVRKPADSARARECFRRNATHWLRFLGRLQPPEESAHSFPQETLAYTQYLRQERGLAETTITSLLYGLRDFLDRLAAVAPALPDVTVEQVDGVLSEQVRAAQWCRSTVSDHIRLVRAFLRFAHNQGWCRAGLAEALMPPRVFGNAGVPAGPSWDDVRRMLALTEGDEPAKIRSRALLLLLAVYGLRAGEVVGLRLGDLDWERERLTVARTKTRRPRVYPLVHSVGQAIIRYLKQARPKTDRRELFLSRTAPIRPLHRCCLYVIVARHARAVNPALGRFGPHCLRHACAAHLLHKGLTLDEIGEHLGHRDPDSTSTYAKVDRDRLRQVGDFDLEDLL
jgi:site-specific recombinase XerD